MAPLYGAEATPENAARAIREQIAKTGGQGAAQGAYVQPAAGGVTVDPDTGMYLVTLKDGRVFRYATAQAARSYISSNPQSVDQAQLAELDALEGQTPTATSSDDLPTGGGTGDGGGTGGGSGTGQGIAQQAIPEIINAIKFQFKKGLVDPFATGTQSKALFGGKLPTAAELTSLSNTQAGALESALSADAIDPADFIGAVKTQFQGFQAGTQGGQRANVGKVFF